jgi:hypothetical protein
MLDLTLLFTGGQNSTPFTIAYEKKLIDYEQKMIAYEKNMIDYKRTG